MVVGLEKPKGRPIPYDEFASEWLRTKVQIPIERSEAGHLSTNSARSHEQQVRLHLVSFFGSRDVREIRVSAIDELWRGFVEIGRPPSRRSREIALGTLRQILGQAVARELLPANPVDQWKSVQPKGRASNRSRSVHAANVLGSEEREHFLSTMKRVAPAYFGFVLFLAETGCRVGEAIALRWSDVEIQAGVATVHRQKTGGTDALALSKRLLTVLEELRPNICPPDMLAFTTPSGSPIHYFNFRSRVWTPVVREAFGRKRFTIHGLRHAWTTLHLAAGTSTWTGRMTRMGRLTSG